MMKYIFSAAVFILSAAAHLSVAQTILSDTVINDRFVFTGEYLLKGHITFGSESDLYFSRGTKVLLEDSTYLTVLGSLSYSSDYDSVSVTSLVSDLSSIELHFIGQSQDSIEMRNWSFANLLLQARERYPDSVAVLNFRNYASLDILDSRVSKCGISQVIGNGIGKTFGAVMIDNVGFLSIRNSIFTKCQSSNTGGALTVCNSGRIYLSTNRFYENIGIDSSRTGGALSFWGQGSSCSIDISNDFLSIDRCVFAFDKECVTANYLSAKNTLIDNSLFYDNSRVSLLTQASVANRTTINSSSFLHCDNAVSGGPNLLMKNCVISNDTITFLNDLGKSVEFFVNVQPAFESTNVFYPRGAECLRCGSGFLPYDESDEILDESSFFELDGYVFEGVIPSLNGLLVDESIAPCLGGEIDVFGGVRCIGVAPDIGAVERPQTIAIKELDKATDFHLYPNPTSKHLYVSAPQAWEAIEATLIDLSGRQVSLQIDKVDELTNLLLLPAGLVAGAYFVKVSDASGSSRIGKVVISLSR